MLILFLAGLSCQVQAQDFIKAPEDKAVVYFVRTSGVGFAINFKYFDGEQFLGIFSGKGYLVYKCDPGEHILWSVSENTDYVIALLEGGQTYLVEANVQMGGIKAQVELNPVSPNDEKALKKIGKLVGKKKPEKLPEVEIAERNERYADYMQTKMQDFNAMAQNNYEFKRLTRANALPTSYLYSELND